MGEANQLGIIYLDSNGILVFTASTPSVLQLPFTPDIVRDLEVINFEKLQILISNFFLSTKLPPFHGPMLISSTLLFEKQFKTPQDEESKKELALFLENVPFEHTTSIIFESTESKMIATNKDFLLQVTKVFEEQKCVVETIIPSYILGVDVNAAMGMNQQLMSDVVRKSQGMKQYGFLTERLEKPKETTSKSVAQPPAEGESKKEKPDNTRTFLLLGVFGVLIIVLIIVAVTML